MYAIDLWCILYILSIDYVIDLCDMLSIVMHPANGVDQWCMIVVTSLNDACSSCYQSMINTLHVLWSIMKSNNAKIRYYFALGPTMSLLTSVWFCGSADSVKCMVSYAC